MLFICNGLVLSGAIILASALWPVRAIFRQLPEGPVRYYWKILTFLILAFIAGYIAYIGLSWHRHDGISDLVVPAVFFGGANFVLLVCWLSRKTTQDIIKVYTLESESITDPLLGIYNRRYMDRRLEEEISKAHRYGLPLTVFLLDLDYFKGINDRFGHPVGDVVLKKISQFLVASLRETDILVRYGGEEFLGILPNTSEPNGYVLVDRLRQSVKEFNIDLPDEMDSGHRAIRITASAGVVGLNGKNDDSRSLLKKADDALYQAKHQGRNRVVGCGGAPPADGLRPADHPAAAPPN